MKNLQNLVEAIAQETNIPKSDIRKVSLALLEKLASLVDNDETFKSPVAILVPKMFLRKLKQMRYLNRLRLNLGGLPVAEVILVFKLYHADLEIKHPSILFLFI